MNINRKKILYKILIYIIIFLITFFLLILIYDFFFKNKYIYNINNFYHAVPNTVENYQNDDQRLKGKKKIKITNDEYGFRNNLKILETDILFLGDSLIRATNTSDKYLLSNSFNEKVYNAGMDGFSTYNSVEVAKFLLKKKKFKKIFLFFNLNNDFRDNIYQIRYNNNLKDKFFIFLKNTSFFYELIKLKNLIYYENIITFKSDIKEINKPYYSINFLKLLINDTNFHEKAKINTSNALSELKKISEENQNELTIIAVPSSVEIKKDYRFIKNIAKDLYSEGINLEQLSLNINYDNPKKIFLQICHEINLNCYYLDNLDINSFYELDTNHWNDRGQAIAKDFLIKKKLIR